jgi:hypothetical protein
MKMKWIKSLPVSLPCSIWMRRHRSRHAAPPTPQLRMAPPRTSIRHGLAQDLRQRSRLPRRLLVLATWPHDALRMLPRHNSIPRPPTLYLQAPHPDRSSEWDKRRGASPAAQGWSCSPQGRRRPAAAERPMEDTGKEGSPWRELHMEDDGSRNPPWPVSPAGAWWWSDRRSAAATALGHGLNADGRDRRSRARPAPCLCRRVKQFH